GRKDERLHAPAAAAEMIVVKKTEILRDVIVAAPGGQRLREGNHVAFGISDDKRRRAALHVPRFVFGLVIIISCSRGPTPARCVASARRLARRRGRRRSSPATL